MSKRMERELKTVNPKLLYKRKRKNSLTEPVLLTGASSVGTASFTSTPPTVELNPSSPKTPPNSPLGILDNHAADHMFPRATPPLTAGNFIHNSTDSSSQPKSLETNEFNQVHSNSETGKSVIVNLSLTGSNLEDKRRLSRILEQVNQMRQLRERHNSYGSHESLEAKVENFKTSEMKRIEKLKRSRRILIKYKVYDFLKSPTTIWATIYHVVAFSLVAACLIVSIFPNMEHMHVLNRYFKDKIEVLDLLEYIVLFWFTAEYLLKLWACECRPQYQGWRGKLAFVKAPAHLLDLAVIILSAIVSIWTHEGHEVFAFRAFRGFHRFFQVIQVMTVQRQLRPWRLFLSVLYDQREQLMIIFYLEIVIFSVLAYLCFLVEHGENEDMETIADLIWWSIVTLTTVGYGDKVPITWRGKLISSVFILFGFCMFALPAGIIGAGLALKLEEVERSRQRRKKKDAAAQLIQQTWRCYRANQAHHELSTFFRHQAGDLYKERVYENICLAFVATVRFHLAKAHFKELTRTVDLRHVVESYKFGQMDIFARLKHLNSGLDLVVSRMSIAEHERTAAINRLIQALERYHPALPESGGESARPGNTLVRTDQGSFLINTVGDYFPGGDHSSERPDLNIPPPFRVYDLVHITNQAAWNQEAGQNKTRAHSFNPSLLFEEQPIPFIDAPATQSRDTPEAIHSSSVRHRRRHSK